MSLDFARHCLSSLRDLTHLSLIDMGAHSTLTFTDRDTETGGHDLRSHSSAAVGRMSPQALWLSERPHTAVFQEKGPFLP